MPSTFIFIVTLSLITILSPYHAQATYVPDIFESALDTVLCQSVKQMHQTIIDIRSSIDRGASLVDGMWVRDLDTCISQCCGKDDCDFALYKTDGSSSSGKNCYFVNCGDKRSNCVMVEHSGFTSVVMGGRQRENEREMVSPQSTQPPTPPTTTSPPPTHITHTITTIPSSHSDKDTITSSNKNESYSETTDVPVPVSHFEPTQKLKPSYENPNSNSDSIDKEANGVAGVEENHQNTKSKNEGSGLIAAVIVGVVCLCIVVIVVGVLARKIWTDQRRKRFRNVDYLINGMYT